MCGVGGGGGKAVCWRAGGRQQIQAGAKFPGSVLHLDCGVVLWVMGLRAFYPNCEFYCMQILPQSSQQQAEDSFQPGPWVPRATSVSLSDENQSSFSLLRLPARLPRQ